MTNKEILEKFYPTSVNTLENYLGRLIISHESFEKYYEIRKNIAYSFQYLEYLDFTLSSKQPIRLTDVIERMTIRSFIITAMSIVEGILYYKLSAENLHKKKKYKLIAESKNEFNGCDEDKTTKFRQQTKFYKLLDDDEQEIDVMDLDTMLKKAQHHHILGDKKDDIYKELNYLRKLRNSIHLQIIGEKNGSNYDTVYHKFTTKELDKMKKIIYDFLSILKILDLSTVKTEFPYLIPSQSLEIDDFLT
jgi:hypothetical protein